MAKGSKGNKGTKGSKASSGNQVQSTLTSTLTPKKGTKDASTHKNDGNGANVTPEPSKEKPSDVVINEGSQLDSIPMETTLDQSDKEKARELLQAHINRTQGKDNQAEDVNETDEGYASDATNAASNTTSLWNKVFNKSDPRVKHVFFYKAKLAVPQNEKFYEALREVLSTFIKTTQEADKDAKIMKFKDKTNRSFLYDAADIPTSPSKIKEYFPCKYRAKKEESFVWPEIRIGFNIDPEEFLADVKILLRDKGDYALFFKDIQAEQVETVGYFLFSTQGHNKTRIVRSLTSVAEKQYNEKLTLALRWKKIGDPSSTKNFSYQNRMIQNNKPEDPKALHVETIKGQGERVANVLRKVYSASNTTYPDGEKFRFIPLSKYLQNKNEDEVHAKVLNRQRWFLSGSMRATSFEIQDLDISHSAIGKSFRQIVLEDYIEAKENESLFISVDISYDGGVSFLFPVAFEAQARSAIADFGPYLRHIYGDMILVKHFTPEAAARAAESEWDTVKKCSISGLEKSLNEFVDECDNISWLKSAGERPVIEMSNVVQLDLSGQVSTKPSLKIPLPNDDSSLPTLTNTSLISSTSQKRSRTDEASVRSKHKMKRVIQVNDDDSDVDMQSLHTINTISSRMDSIESTLANMNAFFQAFQSKQNISTTDHHTQPRPLANDGIRNIVIPASAPTDKGEGRH